jgi:hypothetical protein
MALQQVLIGRHQGQSQYLRGGRDEAGGWVLVREVQATALSADFMGEKQDRKAGRGKPVNNPCGRQSMRGFPDV